MRLPNAWYAVRSESGLRSTRRLLSSCLALLGLVAMAPAAQSATYYVENTNPSCSNSGAGTQAQPFCTISAAVNAARAIPGNTFIVKAGVYREQVTVPGSGAPGNPLVIQANGPGVIVDGSVDLSQTGSWTLFSGNVYRAASVTVSPKQVIVEGDRLTAVASAVTAANVPSGGYKYVSGEGLYVNVGGANPGTTQINAGVRNYGFRLDRRSHVVIDGFTVRNCDDRGIYLTGPSLTGTVIQNNTSVFAVKNGIAAVTCTSIVIRNNVTSDHLDHGIYLQDCGSLTVEKNESMRNARPATRAANGIYLNGTDNCIIRGNRLWENQDTGLNFASDADNNICYNNLFYRNGDHGTDHVDAIGNVHIGDVAVRNYKDGFSYEGDSPNGKVYNCIGIDNGIHVVAASLEYNLWVDNTSAVGFQSDYNIWWNSTSAEPIKYISTKYATIAAFTAATGQDAHSIQANPLFADTLAGNFRLKDGSPGIDNAITSIANWPSTDFAGVGRNDDPATPNTGSGPITYAERGAYEFAPNVKPVAVVTADPSSGIGPLPVVANGAGSTDSDGSIVSYTFNFGDGFTVGPQSSPTASHTYSTVGEYSLLLTVLDNRGGTDTSAVPVVVSANLVSNPSFETNTTGWNATGGGALTRSNTPAPIVDGSQFAVITGPVVPATFTLNDSPDVVALTTAINTRYRFTAWVRSPTHTTPTRLRIREFKTGFPTITTQTAQVNLTSSWQLLSIDHLSTYIGSNIEINLVASPTGASEVLHADQITARVVTLDRAPVVTAPAADTTAEQVQVVVPITAMDPDGEVFGLSANLAGLPAGHNASFVVDPGGTSATLTWTPTYADARPAPYNVVFSASNTLTGLDTTAIYVTAVDPPPVVTSPATASGPEGSLLTVNVTASDPDGSAITTLSADLSGLPAGHGATFTPGVGNLTGQLAWTPNYFAAPGPYTVVFSGTNSLTGRDTTVISLTNVDVAPIVSAPDTFVAGEATLSQLNLTVADPDGQVVTTLTANLTNLPAGHGATFTPGPNNASAVFSWTPAPGTAPGPYPVYITAGNALSRLDTVYVRVNRRPVVTAPATITVGETQLLTVNVTVSDPDGDPITTLTPTLTGLPAGHNAVFTPGPGNTTGTLTWTPTAADGRVPPYSVSFTATNSLSGSATTAITVDQPPVVTAPATVTVTETNLLTVNVTVADPDGQAITTLAANLTGLPGGHNAIFTPGVDNTTGTLTWTPTAADGRVPPYSVTFTATNAMSGQAITSITVDQPPVVTGPALTSGTENQALSVAVNASDPDGVPITTLSANLSGLPLGHNAVFTPAGDQASGTLAWTPTFADSGTYTVVFTATNALSSGSFTGTIHVANVDRAPILTAPATAAVGELAELIVDVTVSDPDGDAITTLTANTSALPLGNNSVFTPGPGNTTGRLTWTPTLSDGVPAPYVVSFSASNALPANASTAISVDNRPVVTAPASVSGTENQPLSINVTASDPDGQAITSLTADLSSLPPDHGATFTPGPGNTSGTLNWTPNFFAAPGPHTITFIASNAVSGQSATSVTIANVDRGPVIDCPAAVIGGERNPLTLQITATDPDLEPITNLVADFDLLPFGNDAVFTPNPGNTGGTLTWTPQSGDGDYSPYIVTFMASNALETANASAIIVDRYPRITAPLTAAVVETSTVIVDLSVSDPDAEDITTLTADLSALPAGHNATFTPGPGNATGRLIWTPTYDDARPAAYPIKFRATNALAESVVTEITVTGRDRAPLVTLPPTTIGGESSVITVNVAVSDPEGDAITSLTPDFSNLPLGHNAQFTPGPDNQSGVFTWTPAPAHAPGPYTVSFTAQNALTHTASVTITVDRRPVVTAPATANGAEGSLVTVNVTAADPDGQPITALTADLSGLPAGHDAVFTPAPDQLSGALTWTPTYSDSGGPYTVTFTATNALNGSSASAITIAPTDRAPVVVAPTLLTATAGVNVSFGITASDPDGNPITSLTPDFSGLPAGHNATFTPGPDNLSGTVSWTPISAHARLAPYPVRIIAANALAGDDTTDIKVDQRPVVTVTPSSVTVGEGTIQQLDITAVDPDGEAISTLTANMSGLPAGHDGQFVVTPDKSAGTFTWTPTYNDSRGAPYTITFTASNTLSNAALGSITVTNTDRAPVVVAPLTSSGPGGAQITINVTASDPDGQAITSLTVNTTGLPAGHNASFTVVPNQTSGQFTWTPTVGDPPGPFTVVFTATNALSGTSSTAITVNQRPVVTAPSTVTAAENDAVIVDITAADINGTPITSLTADLGNLPAGHNAVFTPSPDLSTGRLTWTPGYNHAGGPYTVTFTAANDLSGSAMTSLTITNTDRAPVVTAPATRTIAENGLLSYIVNASDPDGEAITTLAATLTGLPAGHGATFTPVVGNASGTFSWTPTFNDAGGPYTVSFTASNALAGNASTAITVTNTDRAPVVSAPVTISGGENSVISVFVTAGDPDGQAISFLTADLAALPAGHNAVFTPDPGNVSGTLTWTPTFSDGRGAPYNVTFTAFNGLAGTGTSAVTVVDTNRDPVVSVTATVSSPENSLITLNVTASDPDGEAITSLAADLSGLPAGHNAVFTPGGGNLSGTFTWTPNFTHAGGPYAVTFTAQNISSGAGTSNITVTNLDRAPVVNAPATATVIEGQQVTVNLTASDVDGEAITSLTANTASLPGGNNALLTPGALNQTGAFTWTPAAADVRAAPYNVTFTAANALNGTATTAITVIPANLRPNAVLAATPSTGVAPLLVTLSAAGSSDPDGTIANYFFEFGDGGTAGPQAGNSTTHSFAQGIWNARVIVTDNQGGKDTAEVVVDASQTNLVSNPGFETDLSGWTSYGGATLTRVAGGHSGGFALRAQGTSTSSNGIDDNPNTILSTPALGAVYRYSCWIRSDNSTRGVKMRIYETQGSTTLGSTFYSPEVTLAPTWKLVTVDYTTRGAGTQLNLRITNYPAASNEVFFIDDVKVELISVPPIPPVAALTVTPTSSVEPLSVTANASGSTDVGGSIASYLFDFGNGTIVGPQPGPTATHTYTGAGMWNVRVIVTDNGGAKDTADVVVSSAPSSAPGTNLVTNSGFETNTTGWGAQGTSTLTRVAGGRTGGFALQMRAGSSATAEFGAQDNPNVVTTVAGVGRRYRFGMWVRSVAHTGRVRMQVRELSGSTLRTTTNSLAIRLTPSWQYVTVDHVVTVAATTLDLRLLDAPNATPNETWLVDDVSIHLIPLGDQAPTVSAPATVSVLRNHPVTVNVTASDPDGNPITALSANVLGLPAGHNAVFTPGVGNTTGTLTWTPTPADIRPAPYNVTFTAQNALSGSATTAITVTDTIVTPPIVNLVSNPGFETDLAGWNAYSGTVTRVAGGRTGGFAARATITSTSSFGIDDNPNSVASGPVGGVYRFSCWIRSDNSTRAVKLRIYEHNASGSQVGSTFYSPEVTLAPTWKQVTVDYTKLNAATSLSLRITNYPTAANEVFFIDDVSIEKIGGPALVFAANDDAETTAPAQDLPVSTPRAYPTDGNSKLALDSADGLWSLQIEGVDGPELLGGLPQIVLANGSRTAVAIPDQIRMGDDLDGNGFEEITARFALEDVRRLLEGESGDSEIALTVRVNPGTPGAREVRVLLEGVWEPAQFAVSFAPNPTRGDGVLSFSTTRRGHVRAQLFDAQGRVVRRLMDEPDMKPGRFQINVRSQDERQGRLSSGIYFYRIDAQEGTLRGRFVIVH